MGFRYTAGSLARLSSKYASGCASMREFIDEDAPLTSVMELPMMLKMASRI